MDLNRIPTQPSPRYRPKRRKRRRRFRNILLLFAFVLICGFAYEGFKIYSQFDNMLSQVSAGSPTSSDNVEADSVKDKPVTILLLGMDTRKQTGSLNTDVIMVAALNPKRKTATVVSIPRDTYMKPAGFRGGKANSFYADLYISDRSHTDQKIKKVFGDYLKVPVDYMSTINFNGFEDVIDAFGGVTVDVDMNMRYVDKDDGTNIHLNKGVQKLDGKQALDFVRYRHSNTPGVGESSDLERNARQQKVISALVGKLKSVSGLGKIGDVFSAVGKNLHTDMPKAQIKSMIGTYLGISDDKIQYIHLEGKWKSPYIQIDQSELKTAQEALQGQLEDTVK